MTDQNIKKGKAGYDYYQIVPVKENRELLAKIYPEWEKETIYTGFLKNIKLSPNSPMLALREYNPETKKFGGEILRTRQQIFEEVEILGSGLAKIGFKSGMISYTIAYSFIEYVTICLAVWRQGGATSNECVSYFGEGSRQFCLLNPNIVFIESENINKIYSSADYFIKNEKNKTLNLTHVIIVPQRPGHPSVDIDALVKENQERFSKLKIQLTTYDKIFQLGKEKIIEPEPQDSSAAAFIGTTSSTTNSGFKLCLCPHKMIICSAKANSIQNGYTKKLIQYHEMGQYDSTIKLVYVAVDEYILCFLSGGYENYDDDLQVFKPTYITDTSCYFKEFCDKAKLRIAQGIDEKVAYDEIKQYFGGNLKEANNYGSKINMDIVSFYEKNLGIKFVSSYGSTECGPLIKGIIDSNEEKEGYLGNFQVGKDIRIKKLEGEDFIVYDSEGNVESVQGEAVVGPPNVMIGYKNEEKRTKEIIDIEGYNHLGDYIKYYPKTNKYYMIDRLHNMTCNQLGDNISASSIENHIISDELFNNCVVYGDNNSIYLAYIIQINMEFLSTLLHKDFTDVDINEDYDVIKLVHDKLLKIYEKHKFFDFYKCAFLILVKERWTKENGYMTGTTGSGKTKRKKIYEEYMDKIKKMRKEQELIDGIGVFNPNFEKPLLDLLERKKNK